jgi:hypothetical protein
MIRSSFLMMNFRGGITMKKIVIALACVLALAFSAAAADSEQNAESRIEGVWGMNFGISCEEANQVMTQTNGASLICQYSYLPGYSEAFYKVNFFGREGNLLLRFSKKGMFLARFAFVRTDTLKSETAAAESAPESAQDDQVFDARDIGGTEKVQAEKKQKPAVVELSANFRQLNAMLTKKYGTPGETLKDSGGTAGYRWSGGAFYRNSITLFENRSLSRNDTVLTYEDTARR